MEISPISNQEIPRGEEIKGQDLREGIFNLILKQFPSFTKEDCISIAELNTYRRLYLTSLVTEEKGEIAALDGEVLLAIKNNSILSENIQTLKEGELTFGQKLADKVASFGGSWFFIITFFSFILCWILLNAWLSFSQAFDRSTNP